jgi:hypothetical protein
VPARDLLYWVLLLSRDAGSYLIVVNGVYEPTQFIFPLSHVCAQIADFISVANGVFMLIYFRGRHIDVWREPRANAVGLIPSLTAQLLYQVKKEKSPKYQLNISAITEDDVPSPKSEICLPRT